ncbi:hypothetical protein L210DRAFT_3507314 [Boletus edulis BED1]|uniref:Uncharacterized protein n=1 Tax=Boletus edulis BED1 TaxID=1328754 RepID=A0AAD4BL07_BOLED|nr:hypothetical protein L210DRAFT_3507314 [Boletus edulis BED1]
MSRSHRKESEYCICSMWRALIGSLHAGSFCLYRELSALGGDESLAATGNSSICFACQDGTSILYQFSEIAQLPEAVETSSGGDPKVVETIGLLRVSMRGDHFFQMLHSPSATQLEQERCSSVVITPSSIASRNLDLVPPLLESRKVHYIQLNQRGRTGSKCIAIQLKLQGGSTERPHDNLQETKTERPFERGDRTLQISLSAVFSVTRELMSEDQVCTLMDFLALGPSGSYKNG